MTLDVGLWSLSPLLVAGNLRRTLQGLPGGDTKFGGEGQGERPFTVFEGAVGHGVYALFMT